MTIFWSIIFLVLADVMLSWGQIQFPKDKENERFEPGNIPSPSPHVNPSDQHPNNPQGPKDPKDPNDPQARFLFGNLLGIGDLFNPCRRCSFEDPIFTQECCMKGNRHCCQFSGGFGGIGPVGPIGGVGPIGPGGPPPFGFPGFSGHGFPGAFPGKPGIGGLKPVGPSGILPFPGGNNFFGFQKFGFCPKPGLFDAFTNRRTLATEKNNDSSSLSFRSGDKATERVKRQDGHTPTATDADKGPQARFFCRDKCFRDFDCPASLKCCMNLLNCRICRQPIF